MGHPLPFALICMIYITFSCLITFEWISFGFLKNIKQILLHQKSGFHLSAFQNFFVITLPSMSSLRSLFLLTAIFSLLSSALRNSELTCRMYINFCLWLVLFGSIPLYVNANSMFFLVFQFSFHFVKVICVWLNRPFY